ncbi:MAG: hypothetical protein M0027_17585 [Candidatus Dormibacteraeota bacterium]|nr:hypothetical protein [Candidatus Dormibacteraeota bacterium]
MRITVNDDSDLVIPSDSIPGFSAKPGDQFELAPDPDGSAWILTRVTDKGSVYGALGTGRSTDEIMEELRGPVDTVGEEESGYGALGTGTSTDEVMERLRGPVDTVGD